MKEELRKKYLEVRKNTSDKSNKSNIIMNKIINLEEYKTSKIIAIYKNLKSEVETNELIEYSLKNNKIVVLPKVEGNILKFYKTDNKTFVESKYGIYEPIDSEEVDNINLYIIPGICFDKYKNRIGFGKGYYDRVKYKKDSIKIGICFENQIYNGKISVNNYDIKMNKIVTEKNIY